MEPIRSPLPSWATSYRITLLVFSGIMVANAFVFIIFAIFPSEFKTSNPNKLIPWSLIFAMLFLMTAIVPYLLSNLVYAILWFTKIKGRGFSVSKSSTFFLSSIPLISVFVLLVIWFPAILNIS